MCNDHPSSVADDDGGYLRLAGQAYYAQPVPLGGGSGGAGGGPAPAPPQATTAPAAQLPVIQLLGQPERLVDTRQQGGPIAAGQSRCFALVGQAGTAADAAGVVLNATSTGTADYGWLTLYPAGQSVPSTSTLNYDVQAYAIANSAVVRLGAGGQLCVAAGHAASHVVLDVTGHLASPTGQLQLLPEPRRLVDTRTQGGALRSGETRCFTLAGQPLPGTSTLNLDVHSYAVANSAIGRVGTSAYLSAPAGQAFARRS